MIKFRYTLNIIDIYKENTKMRNNFTLLYAEDDQTVRESYSIYFNNFFDSPIS